MKVLQLMAGAAAGGAETFFARLALALHHRGILQTLIIRPEPTREQILRDAGINILTCRYGGVLDFSTKWVLKREIEHFKPDIVLTWMNRASSLCPVSSPHRPFPHLGTPRGYYDPKYYKRCDHLLVTTDDLAQFYAGHGWNVEDLSVIPNFAPYEPMKAIEREAQDTPKDVNLLLALGRFHENKGFDTLIEALVQLPDTFLWLGGAGPLERQLKKLAKKLGVLDRIRFLGWRNDVPALLAAADVFVCSSRHEPFGNIVIEAWMHDVPIVAAASEGPSALIEDEVTGLLIDVDSSGALAESIRQLVDDPRLATRLAVAGKRRYETYYAEDVVLPQYIDLFERLAS